MIHCIAIDDEPLALHQITGYIQKTPFLEFQEGFELNYNKFYIGLTQNGQSNNFVILRPKKAFLRLEIRLSRTDDVEEKITETGLDLMDYDSRSGRYRIRLIKNDIKKHSEIMKEILLKSFEG